MDISMPGGDGIIATAEITSQLPETKVVMLTAFYDDDNLFGAIKAGASGYLFKGEVGQDLPHAPVLGLEPPGSHAELDSSAGDVVYRHDRLREDRGVPEGDGRDEGSKLDPIGEGSEPCERGPRIERSTLGLSLHREVMVGPEQRFETALLAAPRQFDPVAPGNVFLSFDHQTQSHSATSAVWSCRLIAGLRGLRP
jgi:CheY-like chemotaxis protein